ncbi:hypothetical protein EPK99_17095 [Neorhizobium lilium]|uniref:DUF5615 domain-containing protein n=1 Tax=Neorhizobium lilium TaxID=2503024 RepID=A0A3S3VFH9_9HYPH|nr:DUF5615 family PIN-like protein [Neorhizobium lilium]RWX75422.1 hypothetical protein EPK99_17095 [Neorhizobium lilium]
MPFFVDAQLPPALARWLVQMGHEAKHVMDLGLASASDREIWDKAKSAGYVIITKDEDFAQRQTLSPSGPQVIWIRLPNSRRRELLIWFDKALPHILMALASDERLVEVI